MSNHTGIEWTDATWNPVVGCDKVSPGCKFCYAKTLHDQRHKAKVEGRGDELPAQYVEPFDRVQLMPDRLSIPLGWKKPRKIFVNSVSDLFHDDVPDEFLRRVFAVMALARQHTFQVLTKRPARMRTLLNDTDFAVEAIKRLRGLARARNEVEAGEDAIAWPLPNVWLGVSVENQKYADERIPLLMETPAAIRWLSCEPLLGPIDFTPPQWRGTNVNANDWLQSLDWVVVGGESGNLKQQPRPMQPQWARGIRDAVIRRTDMGRPWGMPFLFKQWGDWLTFTGGTNGLIGGGRARVDGKAYPATRVEILREDGSGFISGYRVRVGKKRAGRMLDGRTWDEYPAPRAAA